MALRIDTSLSPRTEVSPFHDTWYGMRKNKTRACTHPVRDVYSPLLRHKLQHSTVCRPVLITQFEQHWIADVQSCQFLQCRGRHDNLSAMFNFLTVLGGEYHRVAAVSLNKEMGMPTKLWVATTETKECLCVCVCVWEGGKSDVIVLQIEQYIALISPQPEPDLRT